MIREEKKAWVEKINGAYGADQFNQIERDLTDQANYIRGIINTAWIKYLGNRYGVDSFNSTKPMCQGEEVTA